MRWLLQLKLGMHESDVSKHLRAVESLRAHEVRSEGYVWRAASFVDDGWQYSIDYTEATDHLDTASAWKDVPLPEALNLVQTLARTKGRPLEVRGGASGRWPLQGRHADRPHGGQWITWVYPSLDIALDIADGKAVRVRCELKHTNLHGRSHTDIAECLRRTRELASMVEATPAATGGRGEAVERLRLLKRVDCASLEAILERVARVTPDAPIVDYVVGSLAEHVAWLAEHDRVFPGRDDWRDAVVVGETLKWFDEYGMGWTIHVGLDLGEAAIRHVSGPFAAGVHRVIRGGDEVYAVPDGTDAWSLDLVVVSRSSARHEGPFERLGKIEKEDVEASLGATTLHLRGHWGEETERVVRMFVCAREAARRNAKTP